MFHRELSVAPRSCPWRVAGLTSVHLRFPKQWWRLDAAWALDGQLSFWEFGDRLSSQMLAYAPERREYPGDEKMRRATVQKRKSRAQAPPPACVSGIQIAPLKKIEEASGSGRLLGEFDALCAHLEAVRTLKNPKKCKVCGKDAYTVCSKCDVALHYFPNRGPAANSLCYTIPLYTWFTIVYRHC